MSDQQLPPVVQRQVDAFAANYHDENKRRIVEAGASAYVFGSRRDQNPHTGLTRRLWDTGFAIAERYSGWDRRQDPNRLKS